MGDTNTKLMEQRSLKLFEMGLKQKTTAEVYKRHLNSFKEFAKVKDYDDLLKADQKSIQILVEDYLMHIRGKVSSNSIRGYMAPIELFYAMNDVTLNSKKLHKMFPAKEKPEGYAAYTRTDIQTMLENTTSKRNKAIIHFFACAYNRRGAIPELKVRHLHDYKDGCQYVQIYGDDNAEYETFITPECVKVIQNYLDERIQDGEKLGKESPVFRSDYVIARAKALPMSNESVSKVIEHVVKKAGTKRTKGKKRFNIPITHGFRKYVNSIWKNRIDVNHAYAEKLMGHSVSIPLDNVYLPPNRDKFFKEFQKIIPDLTLSEAERKQAELERKNRKISELEQNQTQVGLLRQEVADMRKRLGEKSEQVVNYAFIDDNGICYYQSNDSLTFKKSNVKYSKEDLEELKNQQA